MNEVTFSLTMDKNLKKEVDEICEEIGLTFNVAVNIFAKALVREGKFPFELKASDPFYSEENLNFLLKRLENVNNGNFVQHSLIEDLD